MCLNVLCLFLSKKNPAAPLTRHQEKFFQCTSLVWWSTYRWVHCPRAPLASRWWMLWKGTWTLGVIGQTVSLADVLKWQRKTSRQAQLEGANTVPSYAYPDQTRAELCKLCSFCDFLVACHCVKAIRCKILPLRTKWVFFLSEPLFRENWASTRTKKGLENNIKKFFKEYIPFSMSWSLWTPSAVR